MTFLQMIRVAEFKIIVRDFVAADRMLRDCLRMANRGNGDKSRVFRAWNAMRKETRKPRITRKPERTYNVGVVAHYANGETRRFFSHVAVLAEIERVGDGIIVSARDAASGRFLPI